MAYVGEHQTYNLRAWFNFHQSLVWLKVLANSTNLTNLFRRNLEKTPLSHGGKCNSNRLHMGPSLHAIAFV